MASFVPGMDAAVSVLGWDAGKEDSDGGQIKKEKELEEIGRLKLASARQIWNDDKFYPIDCRENGNLNGNWPPYLEAAPNAAYFVDRPYPGAPVFQSPRLQDGAPLPVNPAGVFPRSVGIAATAQDSSNHHGPIFHGHVPLRRSHRGGRQRERTPPFQTEEERHQWEKERRKKDIHNRIEQRRRYNINDKINALSALLINAGCEVRQSKGIILEQAIRYIKTLRHGLRDVGLVEDEAEKLKKENMKIFHQIQNMEGLLQTKGFLTSSDGGQQAPCAWLDQ